MEVSPHPTRLCRLGTVRTAAKIRRTIRCSNSPSPFRQYRPRVGLPLTTPIFPSNIRCPSTSSKVTQPCRHLLVLRMDLMVFILRVPMAPPTWMIIIACSCPRRTLRSSRPRGCNLDTRPPWLPMPSFPSNNRSRSFTAGPNPAISDLSRVVVLSS